VRELEQTVAQQQDTIEQLMPSRRAILAGGAGLVGGAALTGQASAQSAAGQVGTSSEPVDVEAATVNADSVNTDRVDINEGQAKIYQTSVQTILNRTVTKVAFDSSDPDLTPGSALTIDLANNRITAEVSGLYLVVSRTNFDSPPDDILCAAFLQKDGVRIDADRHSSGGTNDQSVKGYQIEPVTSPPVHFTSNVFQNSGGSVDILGNENETWFKVVKIA